MIFETAIPFASLPISNLLSEAEESKLVSDLFYQTVRHPIWVEWNPEIKVTPCAIKFTVTLGPVSMTIERHNIPTASEIEESLFSDAEKAFQKLSDRVAKGFKDPETIHLLGSLYYYGYGCQKEPQEALNTFEMIKEKPKLYHICLMEHSYNPYKALENMPTPSTIEDFAHLHRFKAKHPRIELSHHWKEDAYNTLLNIERGEYEKAFNDETYRQFALTCCLIKKKHPIRYPKKNEQKRIHKQYNPSLNIEDNFIKIGKTLSDPKQAAPFFLYALKENPQNTEAKLQLARCLACSPHSRRLAYQLAPQDPEVLKTFRMPEDRKIVESLRLEFPEDKKLKALLV